MPRLPRIYLNGYAYHVLNRSQGKQTVFNQDKEYQDFIASMVITKDRFPLDIISYCIMPNHFHFLFFSNEVSTISKFMHYLMTKYNRRYQLRNESIGHLWQGRYKSFPIQNDSYLLSVIKYIETNPLRAGLVSKIEDWSWSSYNQRIDMQKIGSIISEAPTEVDDWKLFIDEGLSTEDLEKIRLCAKKQLPYGEESWQKEFVNKK